MSQPLDPSRPQDPQHGAAAPYGQDVPTDDAPTHVQPSSPYGQSPADAPASPAAPTPASQPSAEPAWGSAPSPATGPQQAPGQAGAQGPSAAQPSASQGAGAKSSPSDAFTEAFKSGTGDAGFFRAMVDFRFDHFITVKFSSFLYVIAFLVAALIWLSNILSGIMFGIMWGSMSSFLGDPSFNPVPLLLGIVFGWIPAVIALIAMRLGLEFAVATVRTAQSTARLAEAAQKA